MVVRALLLIFFIPLSALAQLTDTVRCKANPKQSYALYVPKAYSASNPPGLILMFEPAARGVLPVSLYRDLADKYNLILACSNNSRNGPIQESVVAGNAMLTDLFARFAIEKKFILSSGFSGGGRTAVDFAAGNNMFHGVITCGAALPYKDAITKQKATRFAEVIGNLDMNYQEALAAEEQLETLKLPHTLILFNAGHQWPPPDAYEDALVWQYLRFRSDQSIASENHASRLKKAQVKIDSGYLSDGHRMLQRLLSDYTDEVLSTRTDSALKILSLNKKLRSEMKEVARADERERSLQSDVSLVYNQHTALAAPDSAFRPDYWRSFRRSCDKLISSEEWYKSASGKRLLDFGMRMCAERYFVLMEFQQFQHAAMTAKIWTLIQPERPGPCVLAARALAQQSKKNEMMDYLKMAVGRGLKDKQAVSQDPAFAKYASDQNFVKLLR